MRLKTQGFSHDPLRALERFANPIRIELWEKPFSILIAEDHAVIRDGLKSLLSCHPDLKVIGEDVEGLEAIRSDQNYSSDLIHMDLSMPRMNAVAS